MYDINTIRFVYGNEFHNICAMNEIDELIEIIKNPILDFNMKNKKGYTGIMLACKKNNYKILEILINNPNINLNITNDDYNCFHIACLYGSIECVKILINSNKFDVNKTAKNMNCFTIACLRNNFDLIDELYKIDNIILQGPIVSLSSLHYMVSKNNFEMVKKLLSLPKINKNLRDEYNRTPIDLVKLDDQTSMKIYRLFQNLNKIFNFKIIKDSDVDCIICYEKIKNGYILNCDDRHVFCNTCIIEWLDHNNTCPLCRKIV